MTSDRNLRLDGTDDAAVESLLRGRTGSDTLLGACLEMLRDEATGDAPAPSAELAALLDSPPDELAPRGASKPAALKPIKAATAAVAACGVLGVSGVAAAHDALPDQVDRVVNEIVEQATPFTVGAPATTPREQPVRKAPHRNHPTAPAVGHPADVPAGAGPAGDATESVQRTADPGGHTSRGRRSRPGLGDGRAHRPVDGQRAPAGRGDDGSRGHGRYGHGSGAAGTGHEGSGQPGSGDHGGASRRGRRASNGASNRENDDRRDVTGQDGPGRPTGNAAGREGRHHNR